MKEYKYVMLLKNYLMTQNSRWYAKENKKREKKTYFIYTIDALINILMMGYGGGVIQVYFCMCWGDTPSMNT